MGGFLQVLRSMKDNSQMSPDAPLVQHPMHAMIAPISAPPSEFDPMMADMSQAPQTQGMSPQSKVKTMSPLERYSDSINQRLMADYAKDQNPYGSPQNHPGFFGKLLHGLSVATGGPNRRMMEEQELGKQLENVEGARGKQELESAQTGNIGAEQKKTEAETPFIAPKSQADIGRTNAETANLESETNQRENPAPKFSIHDTEAGPLLVNESNGQAQHLTLDGQPVGEKMKLTQSQPIIGSDGKAHTYMLDEKGNKVVDLGVHYERPITVNAGEKQAHELKATVYKTYQPVMDSAERFNVMAKNYEDAIKNHDQQAMLSLLYNHMGMTMGLQKGARMTKDLIHEAQQSQPWLKGIQARFDKDGYLSGVTLSPQQMREMVNNAQGRYNEDVVKARNEAKYLGAQDDGPDRTPNTSVINFYLGKAGGDVGRAKQLAAQDGWSVR